MPDWVYPLPYLGGYPPQVSDPFNLMGRGGKGHLGADLCYEKREKTPGRFTHEETPIYMFPSNTVPVLAVHAGTVRRAGRDSHGGIIEIDHPQAKVPGFGRLSTVYRHLSRVDVQSGDWIVAGTVLGIGGFDPQGGEKAFNHLHFEAWDRSRTVRESTDLRRKHALDPAPVLELCRRMSHGDLGITLRAAKVDAKTPDGELGALVADALVPGGIL